MDIHTINSIGALVFQIMQDTMKTMDERAALAPFEVFSHEDTRNLVAAPMYITLQAIESLLQSAMKEMDDYHDKLEAESLKRLEGVKILNSNGE